MDLVDVFWVFLNLSCIQILFLVAQATTITKLVAFLTLISTGWTSKSSTCGESPHLLHLLHLLHHLDIFLDLC